MPAELYRVLRTALQTVAPPRVVFPFVEDWALAHVALAAGVTPSQMTGHGTALRTAALGSAVERSPLSLDVVRDHPTLAALRPALASDDPYLQTAAVHLALRRLSLAVAKTFGAQQRYQLRELEDRQEDFLTTLRAQVEALAGPLHGATYQSLDIYDVLAAVETDPAVCLLVDAPTAAPASTALREKCESFFQWQPRADASKFDDDQTAALMQRLATAAGPVFVVARTKTAALNPAATFGPPWRVLGVEATAASATWLLSTRDVGRQPVVARTAVPAAPAFPLFTGAPHAALRLATHVIPAAVAQQYLDLRGELPQTDDCDLCVALLLDGRVIGIACLFVGAYLGRVRAATPAAAPELRLACAMPHDAPLNALVALAIASSWFWVSLGGTGFTLYGPPAAVRDRETGQDWPVVSRTPEETLALWLTTLSSPTLPLTSPS